MTYASPTPTLDALAVATLRQPIEAPIRLLIVDDHPVMRAGIRAFLSAAPELEIVGEAESADEAITQVEALHPHMVLIDVSMPGSPVTKAIAHWRKTQPDLRTVVLSAHGDQEHIYAMLNAGALGYILKDEHPRDIIAGVMAVARGEAWLSGLVRQKLADRHKMFTSDDISAFERHVLKLVAKGHTPEAAAAVLAITPEDVDHIIKRLMQRFNVTTFTGLVTEAWVAGLLQPERKS